jgi:hypothetical protein
LRQVADAYMAAYTGRDHGRGGAVALWVRHLGERRVVDIDADAIADVLQHLADTPVTKYVGKDAVRARWFAAGAIVGLIVSTGAFVAAQLVPTAPPSGVHRR